LKFSSISSKSASTNAKEKTRKEACNIHETLRKPGEHKLDEGLLTIYYFEIGEVQQDVSLIDLVKCFPKVFGFDF
jgi:hypothetical protein